MSHFKSSGLREKELRYLRGGKTSKICFPFSPSTRHVKHSMWESHSVVFLRGPLRLQIYKVCLGQQLFCLLVPESWENPVLCTLGKYHRWCEFHKVERSGVERTGEKNAVWAEAGAKVRVSMRGARSCTRVCRRACGRWREQRIATKRGGEGYWVGKARRREGRRWREGWPASSCGARGTIRWLTGCKVHKTARKCQTSLWWCFIDQWERESICIPCW